MTEKPLKIRSVYYDGQEPTKDDLNWSNSAAIDQDRYRFTDVFDQGIVKTLNGTNELVVTTTYDATNIYVNVGHGVAYDAEGHRIEISAENDGPYLPMTSDPTSVNDHTALAWNWTDLDGKATPRSTGNSLITIPKDRILTGYVDLWIGYLEEVELNDARTTPTGFFINPHDSYYRNYTHKKDGYIINYKIHETAAPFTPPSYPSGVSWIQLAQIHLELGVPVVDTTMRKYSKLKTPVEPTTDIEDHQRHYHTQGIATLTAGEKTYYEYRLNEQLNGALVAVSLPNTRTFSPTHAGVKHIKVAVKNTGGTTASTSALTIKVNGGAPISPVAAATIAAGEIKWALFTLPSPVTVTTIVLESTNPNLYGVYSTDLANVAYALGYAVSRTTFNEYTVTIEPTYYTVNSSAIVNDRLQITFPDLETTPLYVNGKQITRFYWQGTVIDPSGTVTLSPITLNEIGSTSASYTGYVVIADTGVIRLVSSISSNELPLVKVLGQVEIDYPTRGGLRLYVAEDYRTLVDAEKTYRISKNMLFAPLITPAGCTQAPNIIFSSCINQWGQPHSIYVTPVTGLEGTCLNLCSIENNCCKLVVTFSPTQTIFHGDICVCGTEYIQCSETIQGDQIIQGNLSVNGNTSLGNNISCDVTGFCSRINTNILPVNSTVSLGSNSYFWKSVHAQCLNVCQYVVSSLIPSAAFNLGSVDLPWGTVYANHITFTGNLTVPGDLTVGATSYQKNIYPQDDNLYTLGSSTCNRWSAIYSGPGGLTVNAISEAGSATLWYNACSHRSILQSCHNRPLQLTTTGNTGVVIDSSGCVGINTATPANTLSVNGTLSATVGCFSDGIETSCFKSTSMTNHYDALIQWRTDSGTTALLTSNSAFCLLAPPSSTGGATIAFRASVADPGDPGDLIWYKVDSTTQLGRLWVDCCGTTSTMNFLGTCGMSAQFSVGEVGGATPHRFVCLWGTDAVVPSGNFACALSDGLVYGSVCPASSPSVFVVKINTLEKYRFSTSIVGWYHFSVPINRGDSFILEQCGGTTYSSCVYFRPFGVNSGSFI